MEFIAMADKFAYFVFLRNLFDCAFDLLDRFIACDVMNHLLSNHAMPLSVDQTSTRSCHTI